MNEKYLFSNLLKDLKPARKFLVLGVIFYIPVTFLSVLQPLVIGFAVQYGMLKNSSYSIYTIALFFFAITFLLSIFELAQGICLQTTGQILAFRLREKAFIKVQKLSMGFLDATPMGKLLTRLTSDAESVVEMFSMGAIQIIGDSLFLIGTFLMLFFVHVKLTLYSAIILPVLAVFIYFFRRWTRLAYIKVRESLSNLNSFLQEYLLGIATVQMSARLPQVRDKFDKHNEKYLVVNRQAILLDSASYSVIDAMSYLTCALVLWGAFSLSLENTLSLGVLVAFIEALSRFFHPLRELANRYSVFQSALVSLERIYQVFDWPEEDHKVSGKKVSFNKEIEFKDVSFSYKDDEPVLNNINFTVRKGETIALVGHTGAGKSSVIKLLNRFYECSKGEILIDGRNINTIRLGDIRSLVSVVPQEVFMFQGNLRDNLSFGNSEATDEEIWQTLDLVQLTKKIQQQGGLGLKVKAKGRNFSLGERQLLAIARAIITNPPILVLDEATASVDAATEKLLQTATTNLLSNRTAFVIAHRLSTIKDADRILVFHKGKIVEEGEHDSLIKQDGFYANFIRLQKDMTA